MARKFNILAAFAAAFAAFTAVLFARNAQAATTIPIAAGEDFGPNIGTITPPDVPPPPLVVQGTSPLGLRNNNPFNLEFRSIGWRGEVGSDGRFSIFDTAQNGIRAGMINIHTKMTRDGLNTVRKIITRLSPSFENPTEAFIQFVSGRISVAPDQPITFVPTIIPMSAAIIQFENGQQPFTIDELQAALQETGRV